MNKELNTELLEINSGEVRWEIVEGHWVNYRERKVWYDNELVWHGFISDAGGLEAGDYVNGMCFGNRDFIDYENAKELAKDIDITTKELIYKTNPEDEGLY